MKFAAAIAGPNIKVFSFVCAALERVSKVLVIQIGRDEFKVFPDVVDDTVQAVAVLQCNRFFRRGLTFEPMRSTQVITVKASAALLLPALRRFADYPETMMSLSRRAGPRSIKLSCKGPDGVSVTHDVPIVLVQRVMPGQFQALSIPAPTVGLALHSVSVINAVVSRMRSLARTLQVTAARDEGAPLIITARNEDSAARAFFRNVDPLPLPDLPRGGPRSASVHVSARRLAGFLAASAGEGVSTSLFLTTEPSLIAISNTLERDLGRFEFTLTTEVTPEDIAAVEEVEAAASPAGKGARPDSPGSPGSRAGDLPGTSAHGGRRWTPEKRGQGPRSGRLAATAAAAGAAAAADPGADDSAAEDEAELLSGIQPRRLRMEPDGV